MFRKLLPVSDRKRKDIRIVKLTQQTCHTTIIESQTDIPLWPNCWCFLEFAGVCWGSVEATLYFYFWARFTLRYYMSPSLFLGFRPVLLQPLVRCLSGGCRRWPGAVRLIVIISQGTKIHVFLNITSTVQTLFLCSVFMSCMWSCQKVIVLCKHDEKNAHCSYFQAGHITTKFVKLFESGYIKQCEGSHLGLMSDTPGDWCRNIRQGLKWGRRLNSFGFAVYQV